MAYTLEQYTQLKEAIASGVLTVSYSDKTVTYRTLSDMKEILRDMEAELFPDKIKKRIRYASIGRGFN